MQIQRGAKKKPTTETRSEDDFHEGTETSSSEETTEQDTEARNDEQNKRKHVLGGKSPGSHRGVQNQQGLQTAKITPNKPKPDLVSDFVNKYMKK